ncbi:BON domain-containing protein [Halodesulfovibrio marinisediminis]|uniref:Hyperosmotically inducible protein n=1 Tax=Halodesulfovibrio marinisediminis DSM 17456 TaxID=1121457 RepID=A0A1N6E1Z2_9BACT|nr:BON domain-containing protein [Halodesulfovibrio marinisediminis]SIN76993.1 hyperosmotically inducible protein [Halodesulfovibrio marinisediminis DSM 17456]
MLKKLFCVTVVLTLCYTLSGCAVYNTAVDERNISEQYSDTVITATVLNKLIKEKTSNALDVSVKTYNKKVYLIGEVDSLSQRSRAISTARNTKGVQSVVPYLLLKNEKDFCGTTDNVTMSAQLNKALIADKEIWSTNVSVDVVQCNIVLTGIVGTNKEKQKITQHARAVPKVRSVTSYIQVQ